MREFAHRVFFALREDFDRSVDPIFGPASEAKATRLSLRCSPEKDALNATANNEVNAFGGHLSAVLY